MKERSGSLRVFVEALTQHPQDVKTSLITRGSVFPSFSPNMESSIKRPRPRHIRHRLETECATEAEKDALSMRLQRMRELLSPDGSHLVDNGTLLHAMMDIVKREIAGASTTAPDTNVGRSMMRNSGKAFCHRFPECCIDT